MISKDTVNQLVVDYLSKTDYYLVDLQIKPDNSILIEIDAFEGVSLDFCIEVSKYVESNLDREKEDFELQVSSAGLTEPFKVLKQYEKNIGNEVEVLTKTGIKTSGILTEVTETTFVVEVEKKALLPGSKRKTTVIEPITFNYNEIKYTKYIIRFK
jgi:ribosome maturation factor RimP